MQQLIDLWGGMDVRRRALMIGGLAGMLAILVIVGRMAAAPSYALLYSGLDPAAAGEVISALEARGVAYQVRGDSINVEESQRDTLRMSLAGEGLPAMGPTGYELLDSLSGFGTTSQMFDAAYLRAREGELARTIASSPQIRAARVHLAAPSNDPFAEHQDSSASVSVRPASGGISQEHAQALRYLVASSVAGLAPENVTIMDSDSGRILSNDQTLSATGDAAGLSDALQRNVERLLTARVGPGNAVVEVSVELETSHQMVTERIIDPNSRVIVGTESQNSSNTSSDSGDSAVTVASNLPQGSGASGGGGSSAQTSETRERVTYDMSETQRETETGPGQVRRITVAVLVNAIPVVGPNGVVQQQPRETAELESLRDLVRSAVGFDETRGDVVTIQSMVFEPQTDLTGTQEVATSFLDRLDPMQLIQLAVLAVLLLAIAFGVVRPALAGARARAQDALPELAENTLPGLVGPSPVAPGMLPPAEPGVADSLQIRAETLPGSDAPVSSQPLAVTEAVAAESTSDPVARLRRLIEEREQETVEILRSWMEEDEELT